MEERRKHPRSIFKVESEHWYKLNAASVLHRMRTAYGTYLKQYHPTDTDIERADSIEDSSGSGPWLAMCHLGIFATGFKLVSPLPRVRTGYVGW